MDFERAANRFGWGGESVGINITTGEEQIVHYRNGREAKNGDKVVQLSTSYTTATSADLVRVTGFGILFDAKPGNDHCNGSIAPLLGGPVVMACLCDCLHADDLAALVAAAGLDKRPPGK